MPHSLFNTDIDLTAENLLRLPAEFGYPVWVCDAQIIRRQIVALGQLDVTCFAQKVCSNVHVLRLIREQGVRVDSVSLGEIERALAAGYNPQTHPDDIVFTVDITDRATFERVSELQIPVNADPVDMLDQLGQVSPGHRVQLRVSSEFGRGHSQKINTGGENGEHGIWYTDLPAVLDVIQRRHLQLAGIHIYIDSDVNYAHLEQVCGAVVRQVPEFGQDLQAISTGDGLSIPYQRDEEAADTKHYYGLWNAACKQIAHHSGHPVKPGVGLGHFLVAQAGILITQVRSVKQMGSCHLALIDVGSNDLMCPATYGSYHHISALTANGCFLERAPTMETVVARPLCESGDIFTQQEGGNVGTRVLPEVKTCDCLALHDTGAYGASMSSSCNSRSLLPKILFDNGQVRLTRRRQTIKELLAPELL